MMLLRVVQDGAGRTESLAFVRAGDDQWRLRGPHLLHHRTAVAGEFFEVATAAVASSLHSEYASVGIDDKEEGALGRQDFHELSEHCARLLNRVERGCGSKGYREQRLGVAFERRGRHARARGRVLGRGRDADAELATVLLGSMTPSLALSDVESDQSFSVLRFIVAQRCRDACALTGNDPQTPRTIRRVGQLLRSPQQAES